MANTPVQNGKTTVDPMFFIPDGTVGLEYGPASGSAGSNDTSENTTGVSVESETGDTSVAGSEVFVSEDNTIQTLDTPQIVSVISQTVRRGPGGNNVVDVVLEVENVVGASNYEFRVAKV